MDKTELAAILQAIVNPYTAEKHGEQWQVAAHAWDEAMISAQRALASPLPVSGSPILSDLPPWPDYWDFKDGPVRGFTGEQLNAQVLADRAARQLPDRERAIEADLRAALVAVLVDRNAAPSGDVLRSIVRSASTSASDGASPQEYVLAGWLAAIKSAAAPNTPVAPEFNPNAKCEPTATQCPRCNNVVKHCETFGGTAPLPAAPAPTEQALGRVDVVGRFVISEIEKLKQAGKDTFTIQCCSIDALYFTSTAAPAAVLSEEQTKQINKLKLRVLELEEESEYDDKLIRKLKGLLTGVANALKGPPWPRRFHEWSDLPEVALKLRKDLEKKNDS